MNPGSSWVHLSDHSQVLVLSICCDKQFPSLLYNTCTTRAGSTGHKNVIHRQTPMRDKVNVRRSRETWKVSSKNGFIFRCVELFLLRDQWFDQEHILCKVCICVVSAPGGNTTNLFNHPKSHHEGEYELHEGQNPTKSLSNTDIQKRDIVLHNSVSNPFSKTYWNNQGYHLLFGKRHVSNKLCGQSRF